MDRTYIQSQKIVSRYLSGDLTVREAREFEKFCLEHPDVLNSLPIPVRVKTKMARHRGEELDAIDFSSMPSNAAIEAAELHDTHDDDSEPRRVPPDARRWVIILGSALAIAVAAAITLFIRANGLDKQLALVKSIPKAVELRAPGELREYRMRPSTSPLSSPTINVGLPNPPQWMDLHIDMSESKFNTFLVTIDSVTAGRIMQIRRVARDSNGEMRLSVNSSAFGAGDYDLKFEGYTWRGETIPVGGVRLGMK